MFYSMHWEKRSLPCHLRSPMDRLFASVIRFDFVGERVSAIRQRNLCWSMRTREEFQSDRTRSHPSVLTSICQSAVQGERQRRVFWLKSSDSSLASSTCVCVRDERMGCCCTHTHTHTRRHVNVVRKKEKQNKTSSDGKKHNRDAKRTRGEREKVCVTLHIECEEERKDGLTFYNWSTSTFLIQSRCNVSWLPKTTCWHGNQRSSSPYLARYSLLPLLLLRPE